MIESFVLTVVSVTSGSRTFQFRIILQILHSCVGVSACVCICWLMLMHVVFLMLIVFSETAVDPFYVTPVFYRRGPCFR